MKKISLILAGFVANPLYFDCNPSCPAPTPPPVFNATAGGYIFNISTPQMFDLMPYVFAISTLVLSVLFVAVYIKRKKKEDTELRNNLNNIFNED